MRHSLWIAVILLFSVSLSIAAAPSNLPDGLYLVKRQDKDRKKVEPVGAGERVLVQDYRFFEEAEREAPSYMVVATGSYVPFILSGAPKKDREPGGKARLQFRLVSEQIEPLERFTRANIDRTVAFVVGGAVVTSHRVRVAITGGLLQITRCSVHGCEAIFSELTKAKSVTSRRSSPR